MDIEQSSTLDRFIQEAPTASTSGDATTDRPTRQETLDLNESVMPSTIVALASLQDQHHMLTPEVDEAETRSFGDDNAHDAKGSNNAVIDDHTLPMVEVQKSTTPEQSQQLNAPMDTKAAASIADDGMLAVPRVNQEVLKSTNSVGARSQIHGSEYFKGSQFLQSGPKAKFWSWAITIGVKHILYIMIVSSMYAGLSLIPMQELMTQNYYAAGFSFVASQVPVAISISFSAVFWLKSFMGVPYSWFAKRDMIPGLVYAVFAGAIYTVIVMSGQWPFPLTSIMGGGAFYSVVLPPMVWVMLPRSLTSQVKKYSFSDPIFRKFVRACIVVATMNIYYFMLLIFYYLFTLSTSTAVFQLILVAVFKFSTSLFIYFRCNLVELAANDTGLMENDPAFKKGSDAYKHQVRVNRMAGHEMSVFAKFEISAMQESYFAMCFPAIRGWETFVLLIVFLNMTLFFELMHTKETNMDGMVFIFHYTYHKIRQMLGMSNEFDRTNASGQLGKPKARDPQAEAVMIKYRNKLPENYLKLPAAYLGRMEFYFLGLLAKLFGSIIFCFLAPVYFFGPNHDWYGVVFDFPLEILIDSYIRAGLSIAALVINLVCATLYVRYRANGISLSLIGLSVIHGKWSRLMYAAYWLAPVFMYSQLGKMFMVVYWFTNGRN
ncbi:hypothetical protein MIR68_004129 [Amoeboaphelidium protococcarum]|nr:hypothetical protein MIR68_004129 [Amoeboaphelidium protococcarum]